MPWVGASGRTRRTGPPAGHDERDDERSITAGWRVAACRRVGSPRRRGRRPVCENTPPWDRRWRFARTTAARRAGAGSADAKRGGAVSASTRDARSATGYLGSSPCFAPRLTTGVPVRFCVADGAESDGRFGAGLGSGHLALRRCGGIGRWSGRSRRLRPRQPPAGAPRDPRRPAPQRRPTSRSEGTTSCLPPFVYPNTRPKPASGRQVESVPRVEHHGRVADLRTVPGEASASPDLVTKSAPTERAVGHSMRRVSFHVQQLRLQVSPAATPPCSRSRASGGP